MSDIVERLRDRRECHKNLEYQAANTIESLRQQVKELENALTRIELSDNSLVLELQEQLAAVEKERDELLCVIHRDGGHYIQEHGQAKAYADAVEKLNEWKFLPEQLAACEKEIERLRAHLANPDDAPVPIVWIHPLDIARFPNTTLVQESDEQVPLYAAPVRSEYLAQPEQEDCRNCKNNGATRGICQNDTCVYEPRNSDG